MVQLALVVALAAFAAPARAEEEGAGGKGRPVDKGTFGAGIVIGEPIGICAKLYLKDDQALQAAIGAAYLAGGVQFHIDYVFHPWILQDKDSFVMPVYLGPGLRIGDRRDGPTDHPGIGLRGVIGILFDFKNVPLDAFLELAVIPDYEFGPNGKGLGLGFNAGAGVRYYF